MKWKENSTAIANLRGKGDSIFWRGNGRKAEWKNGKNSFMRGGDITSTGKRGTRLRRQ